MRPQAELNPFARRLFDQFGFGRGLAIVGAIWLAIVAATYATAFWQPSEVYRWLTSSIGFAGSLAQWEAARFNSGGKIGLMTAVFLGLCRKWAGLLRRQKIGPNRNISLNPPPAVVPPLGLFCANFLISA